MFRRDSSPSLQHPSAQISFRPGGQWPRFAMDGDRRLGIDELGGHDTGWSNRSLSDGRPRRKAIAYNTTMHPVSVENVTKRFGRGGVEVCALDRVSLDVEDGQFLAIMGASGSGKSTLLHLMAGLTSVDSGRVMIKGRDLGAMSDGELTRCRREQIGLVFQSFNLIPTLTARQNVALPLQLAGAGRNGAMDKVDLMLDRMRLSQRVDHRPDALSGGEQQRVAIARALVSDPAVILADEPTGNLDSSNSDSICRLLQDLNEQDGATIVMVTHEPAIAIHARKVVLIRDGKLVESFETQSLDGAAELANRYHQVLDAPAEPRE